MKFQHKHFVGKHETVHLFTVLDTNGFPLYRFEDGQKEVLETWCREMIDPEQFGRWNIGTNTVYIVDDNDAMMFKMRWC